MIATLTWNPNTEPDMASYRVYRSVGTGPATMLATVPFGTNTYVDNALPVVDSNVNYSLTAVDTSGNESPHSVTVTKTVNLVPPAAPTGLAVALA